MTTPEATPQSPHAMPQVFDAPVTSKPAEVDALRHSTPAEKAADILAGEVARTENARPLADALKEPASKLPPDYAELAKELHRLCVEKAGAPAVPPHLAPSLSQNIASACEEAPHAAAASAGDLHYHFHYHADAPCPHSRFAKNSTCPHALLEHSNALWVTTAIAAAFAGAYLVQEYGREAEKREYNAAGKSWKQRTERQANAPAHAL